MKKMSSVIIDRVMWAWSKVQGFSAWPHKNDNTEDFKPNMEDDHKEFQLPPLTGWHISAGIDDIIYTTIIAAMAVALIILWKEYQRLKKGEKKRKLSDIMRQPAESLPDAIREVAEFVVPTKKQRFRKRDRFFFHGRQIVRRMSDFAHADHLQTQKKAIKHFLQYVIKYF
jgi:hypothetical protein